MHAFCEHMEIPCLFPNTTLPVHIEQDFYTVYLDGGMTRQGEAVAQHLSDDGLLSGPVLQVCRDGDAEGAAAALRRMLAMQGTQINDVPLGPEGSFETLLATLQAKRNAVVVLWLRQSDLATFWARLDAGNLPTPFYVSTILYDSEYSELPARAARAGIFCAPARTAGHAAETAGPITGWLRIKRIHAPGAVRIQANSYFCHEAGARRARQYSRLFQS